MKFQVLHDAGIYHAGKMHGRGAILDAGEGVAPPLGALFARWVRDGVLRQLPEDAPPEDAPPEDPAPAKTSRKRKRRLPTIE